MSKLLKEKNLKDIDPIKLIMSLIFGWIKNWTVIIISNHNNFNTSLKV